MNPTGPKIKPRWELPDGLIPEGNYEVLVSDARAEQAKISGRPQGVVKCTILKGSHKDRTIWYTYVTNQPGLPGTTEEIKKFKPFKAIVHISIREIPNWRGLFNQVNRIGRINSMTKNPKATKATVPLELRWRPHDTATPPTKVRVWRSDWPGDTFEVISIARFNEFRRFCDMFGIPVMEHEDSDED